VAFTGESVVSGTGSAEILARGRVEFAIDTPKGKNFATIEDVLLCPGFATNVISLAKLLDKGFSVDFRACTIKDAAGIIIILFKREGAMWVVSHNTKFPDVHVITSERVIFNPSTPFAPESKQRAYTHAFATERQQNPRKSALQKPLLSVDSKQLHEIFGHISKNSMQHLTSNTSGITIADDLTNAPECITDCETCAVSKMTAQISRYPQRSAPVLEPFERIAFDWMHLDEGYNNDLYATHSICALTRFHLTATHSKMSSYFEVFEEHCNLIELNWGFKIKYVQTDDFRDDAFDAACRSRGIIRERSAPGTQAQNGKSERAGRSITTIARCLLHASGLPLNLWPEAVPHASTLLNITPTKALDWKTPFEAVFKRKPDVRHLLRYGSRAFYLNKEIPKSMRLQKMLPRANIGYYVGYDSTNIYHIWIPSQQRVIRTRDVQFD
jgi:hypothetical protein